MNLLVLKSIIRHFLKRYSLQVLMSSKSRKMSHKQPYNSGHRLRPCVTPHFSHRLLLHYIWKHLLGMVSNKDLSCLTIISDCTEPGNIMITISSFLLSWELTQKYPAKSRLRIGCLQHFQEFYICVLPTFLPFT